MKRYAIVSKQDEVSKNIEEKLKDAFKDNMIYDQKNPELIISIGGDGTMLYSVHEYEHLLDSVAFIGLHTGTLGFLTDYQKEEVDTFIEDVCRGDFKFYNRRLLEVKTNKESYLALNEFRIENNIRSEVLDVYINDEFLETFRGNGLCVCTVSGSTAYNKSIGGAVVCAGVGIMQLSEIAGIHHNAYRSLGSSLVLDQSHRIHLEPYDFRQSIIGIDHLVFDAKDVEYIDIRISDKRARFAQLKKVSLMERLKRAYL